MTKLRVHRLARGLAMALPLILSPLGFATPGSPPPVVGGWTQFTPSADSRIVYVSSSVGNDAFDGLSPNTPKRTIAAGYDLLRDGLPDWLLLKSGDVWRETFTNWTKSGRSVSEMIRVGSYGTGARPMLLCGNSSGFFAGAWGPQMSHVALTDIAFVADTYDGASTWPKGIEFHANISDVLVENCYMERFFQGMVFDADPALQNLSDLRIRRTVVVDSFRTTTDSHALGMYIGGANGVLLEEDIFDHNGWSETIPGANPTMFRHNIYIQTNCANVTTRGLISARAGATGMQQRPGGLCENHLFLQNPLGIVFGTGGIVRNCVVMDSRDVDSSDPELTRGIGIQISGGNNSEVSGNICAWRTVPATWNMVAISLEAAVQGCNVHDNIVWKWWIDGCYGSRGIQIVGTPSGSLNFRNNTVQQGTGGETFDDFANVPVTLSGNRYYSNNPSAFRMGPTIMQFPQWEGSASDYNSTWVQTAYPSPDRTIGTYMASLGRTASLQEFLAEARQQSKSNWHPELNAPNVVDYFRQGFGLAPIGSYGGCPADLNGDGVLNLNDMVAFQKYYFHNDMRADVNHDGALTVQDFSSYQAIFNNGCP